MGCVHSKKKVHVGSEAAVSGTKSSYRKSNSDVNINNNNVVNGKIGKSPGTGIQGTIKNNFTQTNGNAKKFLSRQTSVFQV